MDNISVSYSYSNKPLKKEDRKKMSFALIVVLENEIYIASDSRSTLIGANGEKQYFSDDYQKIVIVPETNKVVLSIGSNDFDGQNLTEIVHNLEDKKEIFSDLFLLSKKYEIKKQRKTIVCVASIESDMFPEEIVPFLQFSNLNKENQQLEYNYSYQKNYIQYFGPDYITNMTKNIAFQMLKKERIIEQIQSIMEGMMTISQTFDNTIGGPIQMVHITPEKAEWVEGFKPDFIKD